MTLMSHRAAAAIGTAALAVAALAGPTATATPDRTASPGAATVSAAAVTAADAKGHPAGGQAWLQDHHVPAGAQHRSSSGQLPPACEGSGVDQVGRRERGNKGVRFGPAQEDGFDFFVLQVPDFPLGLSWYQGDLKTDKHGRAYAKFVGRFKGETFTIAPGVPAPAPVVQGSPTAEASTNPVTAPVQQYHLEVWFNSAKDAEAAGCGSTVTPFNREHDAGTQAMSTRQFAPDAGPLGRIGS